MKTATVGAGVAVLAAGAVLGGFTPFFHQQGGTSRTPEQVTLEVTWKTGKGVDHAEITWTYTGMPMASSEHAVGGHWRKDIRLPGKGTYVVSLAAAPVAVKVNDGKGGTFRRSAISTCVIDRMAGQKRSVHPAVPGEGCSVSDVVVVP
jgi:hypothetical protein